MSDKKLDEISEKSKVDNEEQKNDMAEYSFINPRHKMLYLPSNIEDQIQQCALEGGETEFEDVGNENFKDDGIYEAVPNNEPNAEDKNAFSKSLDMEKRKSNTKVNVKKNDLDLIVHQKRTRKNLSCKDSEGPIDTSSNLEEIVIQTDDGISQENIKPSCESKSVSFLYYFQIVFSTILILVVFVGMVMLIYIFRKGRKERTSWSKVDDPPTFSKEDYEIWIKHNITVAANRFPWNPYLWLPKMPFWN